MVVGGVFFVPTGGASIGIALSATGTLLGIGTATKDNYSDYELGKIVQELIQKSQDTIDTDQDKRRKVVEKVNALKEWEEMTHYELRETWGVADYIKAALTVK